jgi:hypothetical protein
MAASDPRWFMQLPGCIAAVHLCLVRAGFSLLVGFREFSLREQG